MTSGVSIRSNDERRIEILFTDKQTTPYGGMAAIVAQFLETIGFRQWVSDNIPIAEASPNAKGIYPKIVAQFLTILVGGSRFAHLGWWGHGIEALKAAFGIDWFPQASSVLTRLWSKIATQKQAESIGDVTRKLASKIITWENIEESNLNFDSTVVVRYGRQQGANKGYNPKKRGRPSHHPLLGFLGCGYVVNLQNRSGDASSGSGIIGFFQQTIGALPKNLKITKSLCDSGFYQIGFIQMLESEGRSYIIAAPLISTLQQEITRVTDWAKVADGIEIASFYFQHKDENWEKKRRYVVIRQSVRKRANARGRQLGLFTELSEWNEYRFSLLITNDERSHPEQVWREYRTRANDENVIKDLVENFALGAFCTKNFWTTEAVMLMNALVFYNLVHYLNRKILSPSGVKSTLRTIRPQLFVIPATLGSKARQEVLRLAVTKRKLRAKLVSILERLVIIPHKLNCIAVAPG